MGRVIDLVGTAGKPSEAQFDAAVAQVPFPASLSDIKAALLAASFLRPNPIPPIVKWALGLARTPAYVPAWKRPATIAEGKAKGSIPANAIEWETGNNGGPFSADAAGWAAFMDACNAADAPGAIQTPLTLTKPPRKYLYRGLYGAGPQDVTIARTDRDQSANGDSSTLSGRRLLWLTWKSKVTIRGIDFKDHAAVLGVGYPVVKLAKANNDGVLVADSDPYHTTTEPTRQIIAQAAAFPVGRLGGIALTGSVNVSALHIVRQIPSQVEAGQPDPTGTVYDAKVLDPDWYATCETVPLFTGASCTTPAQVRDAINANTATHLFVAELDGAGQVRLTHDGVNLPRAPWEINATFTGSGSVLTDTRTPEVDICHNTATDCDQFYCAILDVLELGPVTICNNDAIGTWSMLSAPVLRWSELYAANNRWRECNAARPTATGRTANTGAQQPSGSSMTGRNTFLWLGNDKAVGMRYHGAGGGNVCLVENNQAENIQSRNSTDTVNSAVFSDIRNGWQNTAKGRIIRFAYNQATNVRGLFGGDDGNLFYGKLRGATFLANYLNGFGAAFYADSSAQNGSESGAILLKNAGSYYRTVAGIAAAGGGAEPESIIVAGNTFIDGPDGCAWVKIDECGNTVHVIGNLFDGWDNQKNGVDQIQGSGSGLLRLTGSQYGGEITGNRFRRCNPRSASKRLINLWNLTAVNGMTGDRWRIAGNEFYQDVTAYTADTPLVTIDGQISGFGASMRTGNNPILTAAGVDTGLRMQVVTDSNAVAAGTGTATAPLYGTRDFLASYAASPLELLAA